jgi:hypothetical protein
MSSEVVGSLAVVSFGIKDETPSLHASVYIIVPINVSDMSAKMISAARIREILYFFFPTLANSISTGVSRPRRLIMSFTIHFCVLTSIIFPSLPSNGPDFTVA